VQAGGIDQHASPPTNAAGANQEKQGSPTPMCSDLEDIGKDSGSLHGGGGLDEKKLIANQTRGRHPSSSGNATVPHPLSVPEFLVMSFSKLDRLRQCFDGQASTPS